MVIWQRYGHMENSILYMIYPSRGGGETTGATDIGLPMLKDFDIARVDERTDVTAESFVRDIVAAARPVLLKGLVAHWPVVGHARTSPQAAADYIKAMDAGHPASVLEAGGDVQGRFAYGPDLPDFNFNRQRKSVSASIDQIMALADQPNPAAVYVQSTSTVQYLPRFAAENPNPLLAPDIAPRIWISNRTTAPTHNDNDYNLACVVAGRRRFTLFPPDQVTNLYIGPLEHTPSGRAISMASLEDPDFEKFPKFRDAIAVAQVCELEAGDALYIPRYWWHHVQSLDGFNVLINYWWGMPANPLENPVLCYFDAILALKDLPEAERAYWKTMFDHYIFHSQGDPVAHIPEQHRGALGPHTPEIRKGFMQALRHAFSGRS